MIADGLVRFDGKGPKLIGGRRVADGKVVFPMPEGHSAKSFEEIILPDHGTLWSYTIQRFPPKPPYRGREPFEPYAVGYVELPETVIVESRIEIDDFSKLRIGMPMTLTLEKFREEEGEGAIHTYAFRPADEGAHS
ncbi:Zn-ribbon domain-containing OB-fold protein [Henriciella litoralis]|uniref:Zn-ribbon domain-containing OB-fold protein n=1 Tax=Henriciella litoralis TaxID=568102 RepID=UPI00111C152E|nr:OB-fold domain-containing protein [Henriciella litoralis]